MDIIIAETKLREYLRGLPLSTLRVLGRRYGAPRSSAVHKEDLVDSLADILAGRTPPTPRSNRGAPAKDVYVDPAVLSQIERIRREASAVKAPKMTLEVHSEEVSAPPTEVVSSGVLEITSSGYGFLRARNCQPSADGDVFFPAPVIHSLKLRQGDLITCTSKPRVKNDSPAVDNVLSVNGFGVGRYDFRPTFESLTAQYPNEKLTLSKSNPDLSMRLLDLFVPIGKGQRALIVAPPKAGKTTLLKNIARSISSGRLGELIVLLIDERPEEVTDFRMSVKGAEVVYSTFDEGAEHHIRAATLTLERAKRLVELGKDVVILLDSLTKLTRAYNYVVENSGKVLTGGLDAAAFFEPKKFFGAARNVMEKGSLTILATALVETGSRMDDIIYEEFKGTGNSDIFLSRELAERRIFPAIDIRRSGTRKEELLLSEEEIAAVYKLRERGLVENTAGLFDMIKKTSGNADFISRVPEWIRVYKS